MLLFFVIFVIIVVAVNIIFKSKSSFASTHNKAFRNDWDDVILQNIIQQQQQAVQDLGTQLYMQQMMEDSHRHMQEQFDRQTNISLHQNWEDLNGTAQEFQVQQAFSEHVEMADSFQHEQSQMQFDHFCDINAGTGFDWGCGSGSFGDFGF